MDILKKIPHRHFVFSIPKILRRYFLYDRSLLADLSRCAWETLKVFLQNAVPEDDPIPGILEHQGNAKAFRKNWDRLIMNIKFRFQKIYEVDLLVCPKCQGPIRIISFIEDPQVIRDILSHPGHWLVKARPPPKAHPPPMGTQCSIIAPYADCDPESAA